MYEALLEAEKVATLNIEQREYFERVISAVDSVREGTPPYLFIQGPAGTGKKKFVQWGLVEAPSDETW